MHNSRTLLTSSRTLLIAIVFIFLLGTLILARHLHQQWFHRNLISSLSPHETVSVFPGKLSASKEIAIGFIGDSISFIGHPTAPEIAGSEIAKSGLFSSVTIVNHAQNATSSSDWVPGNTNHYFSSALGGFKKNHVSVVCLMLGTNDSRCKVHTPPRQYLANIQSITNTLTASHFRVLINYPPDPRPSQSDSTWHQEAATFVQQYRLVLPLVKGATSGDKSLVGYFAHNPATLDGIHPTDTTIQVIGKCWASAVLSSKVP